MGNQRLGLARALLADPTPCGPNAVDDVAHTGLRGGVDQVAGLHVVALLAAGAIDDRVDALDGGLDPLAGRQVAGGHLDAGQRRARVPAEDSNVPACGTEAVDDEPAERASAAGDEDWLVCRALWAHG